MNEWINYRNDWKVGEIMPQLFPCLKLIDESEDPNSLISEFQIKGSKSKSHMQLFTEWLIKKNAHVLAIDISKYISIELSNNRVRNQSFGNLFTMCSLLLLGETLIVDFLLKKFQSE